MQQPLEDSPGRFNACPSPTLRRVEPYFCDPQSPWQRETNENANGLLLQYFPRKTDISIHSQDESKFVATHLNGRPGYRTPAQLLSRKRCADRLNRECLALEDLDVLLEAPVLPAQP